MDIPAERPIIRALMAVVVADRWPAGFALVDLLDIPAYQKVGWQFIAIDPVDEAAWLRWRDAHPEAA